MKNFEKSKKTFDTLFRFFKKPSRFNHWSSFFFKLLRLMSQFASIAFYLAVNLWESKLAVKHQNNCFKKFKWYCFPYSYFIFLNDFQHLYQLINIYWYIIKYIETNISIDFNIKSALFLEKMCQCDQNRWLVRNLSMTKISEKRLFSIFRH